MNSTIVENSILDVIYPCLYQHVACGFVVMFLSDSVGIIVYSTDKAEESCEKWQLGYWSDGWTHPTSKAWKKFDGMVELKNSGDS